MAYSRLRQTPRSRRRGAVLVLVAILLPVLVGMTALVIDGALLTSASRQAQSAADAAATAAAFDLMLGRSTAHAEETAKTFVQQHNGLPAAVVTLNVPPTSGPFEGNSRYAEAVVNSPIRTWLIQVLGISPDQTVVGRAVAGYRPVAPTADVIVLDPDARPGLSVSGGGTLSINGGVIVNSEGGGLDENGAPIGNGSTGFAATISNNGQLYATDIHTVGGVNTPANFKNYDPNNPNSPLRTGALHHSDPLSTLPPPTIANGANPTVHPAVSVSGNQTVTLSPGIYPSISVSSGKAIFEPGIYIIRGGDLKITDQDVLAKGVMFYLTGSDYDVSTGWPDAGDLENPPPASGTASFGGVTINAGLRFSGYDNSASPFHGMLFYQRRLNTKAFNIQGNSAAGNLAGTIYAKWAPVKISGQGTYGAQFIVKNLDVSGSGTVTIDHTNQVLASANHISLVE